MIFGKACVGFDFLRENSTLTYFFRGHQILVPNRNAWIDPNANKVGEVKGGN